jgi:hypothetical protein
MSKHTITTLRRLESYIGKIEAENGLGGRWHDSHPMPTIPTSEDLTVWLTAIAKSNPQLAGYPQELVDLVLAAKIEGM